MGLFGKKMDRDALIKQGIAESEAAGSEDNQKDNDVHTGNEKIDIELTKINAQLESFGEIRKANAERFSRSSEQMGELRGMIIDANKAMSKIEVSATKAVDLVESVHPEKLMVEVRKQDSKIEAVRAMIESNESIMKDMMGELKRMRGQMNFYKGTEQVLKMNEEVKHELADIKKMEAVVERHADRVETIFLEVEKKFSNFERYDTTVKDMKEGFRKLGNDFEKVRASLLQKEDKKEFVDLLEKFNDFEKHTTNLLKLLDDRSKIVKKELDVEFAKLHTDLISEVKTGKIDDAADKQATADKAEAEKKAAEDAAAKAKQETEESEKEASEELEALEKNKEKEVGAPKKEGDSADDKDDSGAVETSGDKEASDGKETSEDKDASENKAAGVGGADAGVDGADAGVADGDDVVGAGADATEAPENSEAVEKELPASQTPVERPLDESPEDEEGGQAPKEVVLEPPEPVEKPNRPEKKGWRSGWRMGRK